MFKQEQPDLWTSNDPQTEERIFIQSLFILGVEASELKKIGRLLLWVAQVAYEWAVGEQRFEILVDAA
jgi:hypothetical protein